MFYYIFEGGLSVYRFVHVCAGARWGQKTPEGLDFPELDLQAVEILSLWAVGAGLNLGPLEEQWAL